MYFYPLSFLSVIFLFAVPLTVVAAEPVKDPLYQDSPPRFPEVHKIHL